MDCVPTNDARRNKAVSSVEERGENPDAHTEHTHFKKLKIVNMRLSLCIITFTTVVTGFSPAPRTVTPSACKMSIVDDWKDFFSPQERNHRRQLHKQEMAEIEATQKEILERRRDPSKMQAYHEKEEARHRQLDNQHDFQVEQELSQDWTPSKDKPYTSVAPRNSHNMFDDWKHFFSKSEMDHRNVQHHLELLDTADAEQEILERRRDPAKMKAYKGRQDDRHKRFDKQHEIETGLEFAEERVDPQLKDGSDFIDDIMKNIFSGNNKKKRAT